MKRHAVSAGGHSLIHCESWEEAVQSRGVPFHRLVFVLHMEAVPIDDNTLLGREVTNQGLL